jgi:hypothetical protein
MPSHTTEVSGSEAIICWQERPVLRECFDMLWTSAATLMFIDACENFHDNFHFISVMWIFVVLTATGCKYFSALSGVQVIVSVQKILCTIQSLVFH